MLGCFSFSLRHKLQPWTPSSTTEHTWVWRVFCCRASHGPSFRAAAHEFQPGRALKLDHLESREVSDLHLPSFRARNLARQV